MNNTSNKKYQLKTVAILVAGIFGPQGAVLAAEKVAALETSTVEVVSTTPLAGVGLPIEQVPASVQVVKGEEITKQGSLSIADFMNNNLQGVSVNETQNNPYQPDILFRGFTASPLLGTPQGLSVFQDGVRVNEPFGDAVNWDLIPANAIAGISLIPGSNPVFGLNTLGGSLSVVTKNGRTHEGGAVEVSAGSWGRKTGSAEFGGVSKDGAIDYFLSGTWFDEDGWRDHSPSEVKQMFGKLGWQNETSRLELSYTGANNNMIGNGLIQKELMQEFGREVINTYPDETKNKLSFFNLNGSHWFNDDTQLTANAYYRKSRRTTLNGDVNDDFNSDDSVALLSDDVPGTPQDEIDNGVTQADLDLALADCAAAAPTDSEVNCSGALNRSKTRQTSVGFNAQVAFNQPLMQKQNQLIVGVGYDQSRIKFNQSTEMGLLTALRGVTGIGEQNDEALVDLFGKTRTFGLFATDTLSLNDSWHLTLSGRYNHIRVDNKDRRDGIDYPAGDPQSLTGEHSFSRINPAVGMTFTPTKALTLYGAYNEGMRAPTSMELGCANQNVPCKLPNAMAGDPPLKEVVSKTFEVGARGDLLAGVKWNAAVYRTENHDDIQFIYTSVGTGMGFFENVGKTRRMGFDGGISGQYGKLAWNAGYSYIKATYEDVLDLVNEVNSSGDGDSIHVNKGDRLANIPEHSLKLRLQYNVTPQWYIGSNINAYSDVYTRGNENNAHQADNGNADFYQGKGKVGGYAIVNLDTRYKIGASGWQVFAKATNIFDKKYASGGMMGESWIENGAFSGNQEPAMLVMPGAPRAGWVGVRYEFGGKKSSSVVNVD